MNKSDLIRYANVAAKSSGHDVNMAETEAVIEAFLSGMTYCFDMNEDVLLSGFGKFVVTDVAPTTRRDPRNGEKVSVPAKRTVRFRISKKLKERISGRREYER